MTMSKHHLHVAALVPAHLTPAEVIAALHDHNTCLTLQALTTGHKELSDVAPEIRKDPYWYPPDLNPIKVYEVTEGVVIIPGVGEWGKKYITFPSHFQNTKNGILTRADTNGVTVRAEFKVIPGGAEVGEVDGEGQGIGYADWVLVEDVTVECAWYMMPFVKKSMTGAHEDICRKVIEKVEMLKRQEVVAAKGRERVNTGKALPQSPPRSPPVSKNPVQAKALPPSPPQSPTKSPLQAEPLPEKVTYG